MERLDHASHSHTWTPKYKGTARLTVRLFSQPAEQIDEDEAPLIQSLSIENAIDGLKKRGRESRERRRATTRMGLLAFGLCLVVLVIALVKHQSSQVQVSSNLPSLGPRAWHQNLRYSSWLLV